VPRLRIALGLEYDGAAFEGWQTQPHGRTVQDLLESALASFTGEPVATICAGRTDARVHALGQVVHLDTGCEREDHAWVRGLNRFLPPQIAIQWARAVDGKFHARFCALARHYEYWILNQPARSALLQARTGWVFRELDVAAMHEAALFLEGRHDFSAFRSAECQATEPVRTMTRCDVQRVAPTLVRVRASADGFLHHMVRNIVGALVDIGCGREPASWMQELLQSRDRTRGSATFDAAGLYFVGVDYDPVWRLPRPSPPAPLALAGEGRGMRVYP